MYKHETISVPHARINVAHINLDKDIPCILLCPGWGESIEILNYSMKELIKLDRPVVVLEHPKQFKPLNNPTNFYQNQYQKARNILAVIKHFELDEVDLITHSEGSMNGLVAASIEPDIFRSAILLNPAGIVKHKSAFSFITTLFRKVMIDARRATKIKTYKEVFDKHTRLGKRHGISSLKQLKNDLRSITNFSITRLIKSLAKSGLYIAVVAAKDDVLFPAEKIETYLDTEKIDSYVETDGWHDEMHYNPEKYADIIKELLSEVDVSNKN